MKRYLIGNKNAYLFVFVQSILYAVFLVMDLTGRYAALSSLVKYCIVLLCFCFALIFGKGGNKSIILCVKTALFFTIVSDLFLLLLNYYICGIITFIIVQQLYSIRILLYEDKQPIQYVARLSLQILLAAGVILALSIGNVPIDALLVISIFYFICIVTNTIGAVRLALYHPKDRSNVTYAVGMVLFLLCDINVGIFNMTGFINLPDRLYHLLYSLSSVLMWTFYAPSQVIITLSITLVWQNKQNNDKSLCKYM